LSSGIFELFNLHSYSIKHLVIPLVTSRITLELEGRELFVGGHEHLAVGDRWDLVLISSKIGRSLPVNEPAGALVDRLQFCS